MSILIGSAPAVEARRRRGALWLYIAGVLYRVRPARRLPLFRQVVRLVADDGTFFLVGITPAGPVCTCPGWNLGCTHIDALREHGLLAAADRAWFKAEIRRLCGEGL